MKEKELQKMCKELVVILDKSRATFFVSEKTKDDPIPAEDLLFELKAEMVTNLELYFIKKIDELK